MSNEQQGPGVGSAIRTGHLRKLKTMKKKYFVLRGEASEFPACLEYYDSKKKYDNKQSPKRTIVIKSCFSINKRTDTKHKYVIALYTKDECFCIILDSEDDLNEWLNAMLRLQNGIQTDDEPKPTYGESTCRRLLLSRPSRSSHVCLLSSRALFHYFSNPALLLFSLHSTILFVFFITHFFLSSLLFIFIYLARDSISARFTLHKSSLFLPDGLDSSEDTFKMFAYEGCVTFLFCIVVCLLLRLQARYVYTN